jgi:hypothetical protein
MEHPPVYAETLTRRSPTTRRAFVVYQVVVDHDVVVWSRAAPLDPRHDRLRHRLAATQARVLARYEPVGAVPEPDGDATTPVAA